MCIRDRQETYLNVLDIESVLERVRHVFASLYNDRAISYRVHKGFAHGDVALSAGVQRMVRSDRGSSGVMFTMDTESGFSDAVLITSDNPRHEPPQAIIDQIVAGLARPAGVRIEPDRAAAIAQALTQAAPADVVLIAGKGHEAWQETAGVKRPFSDLEHARAALQLREVAA